MSGIHGRPDTVRNPPESTCGTIGHGAVPSIGREKLLTRDGHHGVEHAFVADAAGSDVVLNHVAAGEKKVGVFFCAFGHVAPRYRDAVIVGA